LKTRLTRKDVISAWAGYRPLISPAGADGATSKLSRTHIVNDGPAGMITITGGKLTSYRRMAQDTIDHLDKRLHRVVTHVTENLPLDGAEGHDAGAASIKQAAEKYDWSDDVVTRLSTYGSEAGALLQLIAQDESLARIIAPELPYVMAEVAYACQREMAMTLADVLARRLHLNFEDWSRGVGPAPAVAQVMARELGWSAVETSAQVAAYAAAIEQEIAAEKL
jgi:glycerol-3-phosphate dehydrogenase